MDPHARLARTAVEELKPKDAADVRHAFPEA
jgi:hypothetical protein